MLTPLTQGERDTLVMEILIAKAQQSTENKDMYLKLSVHKQKGAGAYVIASSYYKSQGNGYAMKSFIMFKDFNKRIDASIVRAGRVTSKVEEQAMALAKTQLPVIIQQVKAHYSQITQWEV